MKVIVYPLNDTVAVEIIGHGYTVDDVLPRCPAGAVVIEDSQLPQDRYFRGAWALGQGAVNVNMVKARDIHVAKLKEKREKKLKDLDIEWSKALGQKKQKDADDIEAKRQALRDFPVTLKPQIDAAQTPEALKAIIPQDLADVL